MSYINEALKKAQKDKDSGRMGYMHSIGKSGIKERSFDIKLIFLILIIFLLLAFIIYSRSGNKVMPDKENTGNTLVQMPVRDIQYDNKTQVIDNKNRPKEDAALRKSSEQEKISQKEILYRRAVLLFKENRIEEAKTVYDNILLQDPGHINSLNDMGVLSLQEGKYEDAVNYLEKAVKLKPKFVNPFYNLACAYSLQNEGEKGMAYLLKAIEVDVNAKEWAKQDPDLRNLRGYAEFTLITE